MLFMLFHLLILIYLSILRYDTHITASGLFKISMKFINIVIKYFELIHAFGEVIRISILGMD